MFWIVEIELLKKMAANLPFKRLAAIAVCIRFITP
jgi:hypothetical protein